MGEYVKSKKEMRFSSLDSLKSVEQVINEAEAAINDKSRTISKTAIPEVLAGALGAGVGGAASFAALFLEALLSALAPRALQAVWLRPVRLSAAAWQPVSQFLLLRSPCWALLVSALPRMQKTRS